MEIFYKQETFPQKKFYKEGSFPESFFLDLRKFPQRFLHSQKKFTSNKDQKGSLKAKLFKSIQY